MKPSRVTLIKYLVTVAVATAIVLSVLSVLGFWSRTDLTVMLADLTDAFMVAGLLPILIGILVWASSEGMFDGLGYVGRSIGALLLPSFRAYRHVTYYDYKMAKRGKRPHGYGFLFFVGLGYFSIGLVFYLLFKLL